MVGEGEAIWSDYGKIRVFRQPRYRARCEKCGHSWEADVKPTDCRMCKDNDSGRVYADAYRPKDGT